MTAKNDNTLSLLDQRVSALEEAILNAPDAELRMGPSFQNSESAVRRIFAECLSDHISQPTLGQTKSADLKSSDISRQRTALRSNRVSLIQSFLQRRLPIQTELVAVFGSSQKTPGQYETKIIEQFIRDNLAE